MIDEHLQDLAAEYALDSLDSESARAFEAMLATDPELKALTDSLREAATALAHNVPQQLPPPELRERILSRIRAEAQTMTPAAPAASTQTPPTSQEQGGGGSLIPWAIAACFAISTVALWVERGQLQQDNKALISENRDLRNRDNFAKMKIATLSAQVEAYAKASAVIVWDPEKQRGVLKLAKLPPLEAGKDYQLWVIDPKYPQPVSGGVVAVNEEGIARVAFHPDKQISKADNFAISIEPAGGVPAPTGSIVLAGNN
jgi:anti-sigma-K factor RskA